MSECINSPQRVLLKDLLAQKLIEDRILVGRQSKFLAPYRTQEQMLEDRKKTAKEYRQNHKEELKAYQEHYRKTHREQKRATDRRYNLRKKQQREKALETT
jgi:hypothetical protein